MNISPQAIRDFSERRAASVEDAIGRPMTALEKEQAFDYFRRFAVALLHNRKLDLNVFHHENAPEVVKSVYTVA